MHRALTPLLIACTLVAAAWSTASADVPRDLIAHCTGCDLSGMDLHGRDLHGIEFVGADLSNTNLRNADLRNAKFTGADLHGTKFDNANLTQAEFTGVSFKQTSFAGANLTGVKLVGVQLDKATADALSSAHGLKSCTGCDLRMISLSHGDYSDVRFVGVDMEGGNLDEASFVRASLIGANLRSSSASRTNFTDAELVGTDFREANLSGAVLLNAVVCSPQRTTESDGAYTVSGESCIDLTRAKLAGTDLRGIRYCEHNETACRPVTAAELRTHAHADLSGARLDG